MSTCHCGESDCECTGCYNCGRELDGTEHFDDTCHDCTDTKDLEQPIARQHRPKPTKERSQT